MSATTKKKKNLLEQQQQTNRTQISDLINIIRRVDRKYYLKIKEENVGKVSRCIKKSLSHPLSLYMTTIFFCQSAIFELYTHMQNGM